MGPDEDSTLPGRSGRLRGPGWRRRGEEPDYRFSLANERTFLAWIRTALAVLAAGVLLEQFAAKLQPPLAVTAIAASLCVTAAALCALAYGRWRANEEAMRHKRPLPHSRTLSLLAIAIPMACLALILLIVGLRAGLLA